MISSTSSLFRVLQSGPLPAATAEYLLGLQFSELDHSRHAILAAKAQEGTLTADERIELDDLLTVNDLLSILHSRARKALARSSPAA